LKQLEQQRLIVKNVFNISMYFIFKLFKNLLACAYLQYIPVFSTVHLRSQHESSEQNMQSKHFCACGPTGPLTGVW